jgi:protein-S-isoprenylcysteine O-methyltransferase Ste14
MLPDALVFLTFLLALYCHLAARLAFIPKHHVDRYARAPKSAAHLLASICFHLIVWFFSPARTSIANLCHGIGLFAGGSFLYIWAHAVNEWFVPHVAIPPALCQAGPYKWLRHPGYLGFAAMSGGMALMLGSLLCLIPMGVYWLILVLRALEESDMLDYYREQ